MAERIIMESKSTSLMLIDICMRTGNKFSRSKKLKVKIKIGRSKKLKVKIKTGRSKKPKVKLGRTKKPTSKVKPGRYSFRSIQLKIMTW